MRKSLYHHCSNLGEGRLYDYCWLIRVREDGKAIQDVTGYFDTALVNELLAIGTVTSAASAVADRVTLASPMS